jgi:hypothetical protein
MNTIQACVNPRLLTKADRLFTGTLSGRIIEILQNARRAGATKVVINNQDDLVTVRDNGQGIEDFAKLLDFGGSGWEEELESSEDPAGVGLFCLTPRQVTIRSNGQMVTIESECWTGQPADVSNDPQPRSGTILQFADEPWTREIVERHAVFCGMQVIVDDQSCPSENFVSDSAAHHPEMGCHIEVRADKDLGDWHRRVRTDRYYGPNVLVNFHGQTVSFDYRPVSERDLCIQVDLTGEPTGIRLMLPARTRLVENEIYKQLLEAMELEVYRYIQRRGHHTLIYKEYLRSQELGIQLPEAKPTYTVGLISTDMAPEPVELAAPKDFPLCECYRMSAELLKSDDFVETNAHLLAALGTFEAPFIPVLIQHSYDGYSWANLPTIDRVEVSFGKEHHSDYLWSGQLVCVDDIVITAHTSNGKTFSSSVCMGIHRPPPEGDTKWSEEQVLVTPESRERLSACEIWYHLGGWSEDGDTYDTQEFEFGQALDRFWAELIGPDENLRRQLVRETDQIQPEWHTITITPKGDVTIHFADGATKTLQSPSSSKE